MNKVVKIAVDAMGGDGSPKKNYWWHNASLQKNPNTYYQIFGDENKINNCTKKFIPKECFEIINTNEIVMGTDSPLEGAKRGKKTSMWLAVQSVKKN
jgi:glycerol-3-phosphate acyltransferase PlsX